MFMPRLHRGRGVMRSSCSAIQLPALTRSENRWVKTVATDEVSKAQQTIRRYVISWVVAVDDERARVLYVCADAGDPGCSMIFSLALNVGSFFGRVSRPCAVL